jgi:hypothetical protein
MAKVRHTPGPGAKALAVAVKGLNGAQAKVGWFPSAKYEDGTPVALVAVVQEFGSPTKGIPPRPFMRTTAAEKKAEWSRDAHVLSKADVNGQLQPGAVLDGLAQKAEGDVRQTISKVLSPPLSERTIQARKRRHSKGKASSKPLVDTGIMLNTLTSQVGKK